MLTKEIIDQAINNASKKWSDYKISSENLTKFSNSKEDQMYLSILNSNESRYFKFLPLFINELGLKNIVELGNREALSTLCIYDKLHNDASFVTIDILKDQRYCPGSMFCDNRVKFVFGDVCDLSIFDKVSGGIPMDIEFLFSDTIHFNFQISDEFEVYQHLLADKALVAIDDININDKRKFFDAVTYEKWDLTEICHKSGWGLFLYERKKEMTKDERLLEAYKASSKIWKRKNDEKEKKLQNILEKKAKV